MHTIEAANPPTVEDSAYDEQPSALHRWIMSTGIWYVVSMVVHCAALVSAGLLLGPVAASTVEKSRSFESIIEPIPEPPALTRIEPEEPQLEPPDLEMLSKFDVAQDTTALQGVDIGIEVSALSMNLGTPGGFDMSGLGFGPSLRGSGGLVPGPGNGLPGATFFTSSAAGRKFCFVVDNSRSMGRDAGGESKWERAKFELLRTISKLGKGMSYYVVFFNAKATRIFDPEPSTHFVASTPANYDKFASWLAGVELSGGTRGTEAMQIALDLKPDAIFVLGDGAFTDDVVKSLKKMNPKKIPINTLLFSGTSGAGKGRASMQKIADDSRGAFMPVK